MKRAPGLAPGRAFPAAATRTAAAQALFQEQFDAVCVLADAWRQTPDDEALHRFRVGLRRFRVLLRIFDDETLAHGGRALRAVFTRLGNRLGAVRDMDVMMALIDKSASRFEERPAAAARLQESMMRRRARSLQLARRQLQGPVWLRAKALGERFLARFAAEVPSPSAPSIQYFFTAEFKGHCRRIRREAGKAESTDSEVLHAFRIRLRRLRYLADLLSSLANARQRKLIKRVRQCEQCLGRIHDVDMALAFLAANPVASSEKLRLEWESLRHRRRMKFRTMWEKCRSRL